jgi:hypothetical protein
MRRSSERGWLLERWNGISHLFAKVRSVKIGYGLIHNRSHPILRLVVPSFRIGRNLFFIEIT